MPPDENRAQGINVEHKRMTETIQEIHLETHTEGEMGEREGHTQRERGEEERERLARNYETMNAQIASNQQTLQKAKL